MVKAVTPCYPGEMSSRFNRSIEGLSLRGRAVVKTTGEIEHEIYLKSKTENSKNAEMGNHGEEVVGGRGGGEDDSRNSGAVSLPRQRPAHRAPIV